MDRVKQNINIPDNIAEYIKQHDGVNLAINFNSASINEYAHKIYHSVVISVVTRTCIHCGYDLLWKPEGKKCTRCTYGSWRYDDVFMWTDKNNPRTLEECFNEWNTINQSRGYFEPCKYSAYGDFGY